MGEAIPMPRGIRGNTQLESTLVVWLLHANEIFKQHIQTELMSCPSVQLQVMSVGQLKQLEQTPMPMPDLIFVETGPQWVEIITQAQQLLQQQISVESNAENRTSLVVFGDETDSAALKTSLRLGATDFFSRYAPLDEFLPLLHQCANEKQATSQVGELFVFVNAKGGAGATTLALNSAVEVAQRQHRVLLLDLDIHYGVVADYLNVVPKHSITDIIDNLSDLDEMSLNALVTKHATGLDILTFKQDNNNDNFDKLGQLGKLLPTLRQFYPYVYVDLSTGVDRNVLPVLFQASKVFITLQQNLVSVKNTTRILKALTFDYGVTKDQIELIVNRFDKKQQIKLSDIEKTFPHKKIHSIPNDFKAAIDSANLGKPFVVGKKRSAMSKGIVQLTQQLLPQTDVPQGWFKSLFSKN
ncbi:AAA family ATPase [Vibrio sp. PNB22_3_1]